MADWQTSRTLETFHRCPRHDDGFTFTFSFWQHANQSLLVICFKHNRVSLAGWSHFRVPNLSDLDLSPPQFHAVCCSSENSQPNDDKHGQGGRRDEQTHSGTDEFFFKNHTCTQFLSAIEHDQNLLVLLMRWLVKMDVLWEGFSWNKSGPKPPKPISITIKMTQHMSSSRLLIVALCLLIKKAWPIRTTLCFLVSWFLSFLVSWFLGV